jgi:hypothetical protein
MAKSSSELALVAGRAASACFAVSFALDIGDIAVGLHVDPLDFAAATTGRWPAAYVSQHAFELTAYGLSIAAVLGFFRLLHELLGSEHAVWLVPLRDQDAPTIGRVWLGCAATARGRRCRRIGSPGCPTGASRSE